jgi:hypothetical protein
MMVRPARVSPDGCPAFAIGVSLGYASLEFGYWPCLKAPFVRIQLYRWIAESWFGLPSYRLGGRP